MHIFKRLGIFVQHYPQILSCVTSFLAIYQDNINIVSSLQVIVQSAGIMRNEVEIISSNLSKKKKDNTNLEEHLWYLLGKIKKMELKKMVKNILKNITNEIN